MDRVYFDNSGRLCYCTLNENGTNSNQRVFASDAEEKRFLDYLGEDATKHDIRFLQRLYNEYKKMLSM
jgi:hypothetical protein